MGGTAVCCVMRPGRFVADPLRQVVGVVLAAGMSRRLGRPKQFLMLGDMPVIRHVVRRALRSALDEVVVVIGAHGNDVRESLAGEPVRFVVNERYAEGQGASLAAGVSALGPDTDAAVILLGDQPEIDPVVIDRVVGERYQTGASIVMAQYGGERSHPVLFGREHFLALASLEGDQGGREIIRRHADDVRVVPAGQGAVPGDIDTEEDWRNLSRRWSGG